MERDHTLKLRRAHGHLKYLDVEGSAWTKQYEKSFEVKRDPKRGGRVVVTATAAKPPADPFSLEISECLHNLRSSLDVLAYALDIAYSKSLSDEVASKSEFPIIGDVDRQGIPGQGERLFTSNAPAKIQGVHPDAQAVIKGLQPYKLGTPKFRTHPLWALHALDRISKHRLLHAVVGVSMGVGFRTGPHSHLMVDPGVTESHRVVVTENPTEVAVFPYIPGPTVNEEPVDVDVVNPLTLSFGTDVPLVPLEAVTDVLAGIYNWIVRRVLPPLAPFLD